MSLRELPPEQQVTSRWRHVRYVPLTILVVLGLVAAVVGFVVSRTQIAPTPEFPTEVATPEASRLPAECRPPAEVPVSTPWTVTEQVASETVWAAHAAELQNPYVEGEDGWVFWGDIQNNNFSQAVGRRFLTAAELEQWHAYFAGLDEQLSAAGIPLYIVIAPAKWAVYPDELPGWTDEIRGIGPLDQLLQRGGDLPLVDLRGPLQEASVETQTYSRLNSHWSGYGAMVGWNALAECIAADQPDATLAPIAFDEVLVTDRDFNEFAPYGFEWSMDWTEPVLATEPGSVELSAAGEPTTVVDGLRWTTFDDMPAKTRTPDAPSDVSVLFLGDSFGVVMSPYLQQSVAETWQQRHNLDGDPSIRPDIVELALSTRPDIVILEIAQRHLNLPPAAP